MSAPSAYETPGFRAPIDLDLSRNEGRPGALSLDRLTAGLEETVSRYPDVTPLREALAHRLAVSPDQVLITAGADDALRSEEHTSELQSRENLVCRLLLEKKKEQ